MPGKLQQLINRINMSGEERITGIITDWTMGWSLEVAEKMNIHRAIFWPASAAILCSVLSISKLVNDGIIDIDDQFLNGTLQNVEEGGCSSRNFKNFVEWMKA
ncbi:hypothetical protein OIU85_007653 [Salix viminalis]|uniref:Uncharacterized protein n=1 Tax=Salix viminalis TaxID=40686 RepID=A0A6N2N018_SALVM|nr:hypothetical protein OIU85_007653 [Salix viminalis]